MPSIAAETLRRRVSDELLPRVRQPAQYIGGEVNQLVRPGDWEKADIRVVIAFPDTYTIGMSHLGCQILYWLCNHTPGVCAERLFSPWLDAERVMRERRIPLFTWDTRQPVRDADILAISLQYEMCFTNVLNLLDLAGIPLRSADRMAAGTDLSAASAEDTPLVRESLLASDPAGNLSGDSVPQSKIENRKSKIENPQSTIHNPKSKIDNPQSDVQSKIQNQESKIAASDLDPDYPLVIVGGPQADNPEPMAEFVDLVVIGDGEHSMAAILDAYREYKRAGVPRRDMILLMARRFPWVYAPNLYDATYNDDGTFASLRPLHDGLPTQIERCKTPDFETAPFPARPIVPWVGVVHDRIGIEIMRGCPQVCRFCHAGYTKRPLNYRSVQRVLDIAEEAYWSSGIDELGLLSLSTADYPLLPALAAALNERFAPRLVNLSFPSLRVDKMLQHIPAMAQGVRKSGLTIAVEAARDDMRRAIRKKVTDGNLLDGVRAAYEAGWNRVKAYFMAGFPGERDDDIRGIYEISKAMSDERRKLGKGPAKVTASVGWLVPKPYTPFQWMAQPRVEYFEEVRRQLRRLSPSKSKRNGSAGSRHVEIKTHDPQRSILEGVFARGDRRLGAAILEAFKRGARHDGWDESFDYRIWRDAWRATGIDPDWYAHRERPLTERMPWEHIGLHLSRGFLEEGYEDVFRQIGVAPPNEFVQLGAAGSPANASPPNDLHAQPARRVPRSVSSAPVAG